VTARRDPDVESAAVPNALAEGLLRSLPEPALLVTRAGAILAANPAAAALFGAPAAALRGTPLVHLVADAPGDVARYLDACARTSAPLPGALHLRALAGGSEDGSYSGSEGGADGERTRGAARAATDGVGAPGAHGASRHPIAGAAVRPAAPGQPALVVLRFRAGEGASSRFALLNRQLDALTREVQARRAAEAALRDANARLQDQALELELANQQLQDQALELEHQIEQARAVADELARANAGLAAAAAAADEARALAEHANQAKTDFLAVMSHELRTPLNAIGGYAELIELGVRGPVTEAQRDDLGRIRRSQRHLLALINEVLNFARLEAGQVRFSVAAVPLDPLLGGLEALIAPQVRSQGLRFVYERPAPSVVARADPEKLQQVLLNLLSNAVKFTPSGGTVSVTAELARGYTGEPAGEPAGEPSGGPTREAEDAQVRIRVRDTGIGIAADRLEHVFEPFVQLDQRLTRPHEGTGLGLAISRDLARGMGGDLSVESTPGVGSVFTLTLPMA
jgi:signal transduction histidine kinase